MRQVGQCIHGGGRACKRQGGDGEASHAAGYIHPYPAVQELGYPVGDAAQPVSKSIDTRVISLAGLTEFFDDDISKAVLSVNLDTVVRAVDIVRKSFYDFDLDSRAGVLKLLELLPIMDSQILIDIAGELWPGYPAQDQDARLLRMEVKGYLMDYLEGHEEEAEKPTGGLPTAGSDTEGAAEAAPNGPSSPEGTSDEGAANDESTAGPGAPA